METTTRTARYELDMRAVGLRVVAWSVAATSIRGLVGVHGTLSARGARARVVAVEGGLYRLALVAQA